MPITSLHFRSAGRAHGRLSMTLDAALGGDLLLAVEAGRPCFHWSSIRSSESLQCCGSLGAEMHLVGVVRLDFAVMQSLMQSGRSPEWAVTFRNNAGFYVRKRKGIFPVPDIKSTSRFDRCSWVLEPALFLTSETSYGVHRPAKFILRLRRFAISEGSRISPRSRRSRNLLRESP